MKPTMNLRFVEKDIMFPNPQYKNVSYVKTVRILQQQFEEVDSKTGEIKTEWREVPLVKEE